MEMLDYLKTALEAVPEITKVEILTHKYNGYKYLRVEGPYDGGPGMNHPVTTLIEEIAARYGKEADGWGWLYQTEVTRAWDKANPAPEDPRYSKDRTICNMFSPSAKNPKNKAARELLAKYKAEHDAWLEYRRANRPSDKIPGFTVSFAPLGHGESVRRFYEGTRYWGD